MDTMDHHPHVGLIYNKQKHRREVPKLVKQLQQLADTYRMNIKLFAVDNLNLTEETVGGLLITQTTASECLTPIPSMLYNLALHSKSSSIDLMRQLRVSPAYRVINPINRFNLAFVYDLLFHTGPCADAILPYRSFRVDQVQEDLQQEDRIMLLPEKAMYYRRAVFLERSDQQEQTDVFQLTIGQNRQSYERSKLPDVLSFMLKDQAFVRVTLCDLLEQNGMPVEARVYVQKDASGAWKVVDMIAKQELFTSTETRSLQTQSLSQVFQQLIPQAEQESLDRLRDLSLRIASHLDFFIPNLGSLTLDLFFDPNGKPYLISIGGFEQNAYLFKDPSRGSWEELINCMVGYCGYLLAQAEQEEDRSDGLEPHQAIRIAKNKFKR